MALTGILSGKSCGSNSSTELRARIEKEVRDFLLDNFLFGEDDGIKNDDSFLEKHIIDSTGILELIAFVEPTYGIQVDSDELAPENFDSITRLVNFVINKVNQPEASCLPGMRRAAETP